MDPTSRLTEELGELLDTIVRAATKDGTVSVRPEEAGFIVTCETESTACPFSVEGEDGSG